MFVVVVCMMVSGSSFRLDLMVKVVGLRFCWIGLVVFWLSVKSCDGEVVSWFIILMLLVGVVIGGRCLWLSVLCGV